MLFAFDLFSLTKMVFLRPVYFLHLVPVRPKYTLELHQRKTQTIRHYFAKSAGLSLQPDGNPAIAGNRNQPQYNRNPWPVAPVGSPQCGRNAAYNATQMQPATLLYCTLVAPPHYRIRILHSRASKPYYRTLERKQTRKQELYAASRLDRPTSGLLPLATSTRALHWLQA